MTVVPLTFVDAPPVTPAQYGILDAAHVVDDPDPHVGFGFQYESEFCGLVRTTVGACITGATGAKTVDDGRTFTTGSPFTVYSLKRCRLVGLNDARGYAMQNLAIGEGRAVEAKLGSLFAAGSPTDIGAWTGVRQALAAIENWVHCNSGIQATIHMSRAVASMLTDGRQLSVVDGHLQTLLGNTVSAGCYVPGSDPLGAQTIWATGPVMLRRGEVFSPVDPVVDQVHNEQYALAERPYVASWDCFLAKVGVTP